MVGSVTGNEDVPEGCVAVIIWGGDAGCPDVLSHSAVRARNMNVLMAAYLGDGMGDGSKGSWTKEGLKSLSGVQVKVGLRGTEVEIMQL